MPTPKPIFLAVAAIVAFAPASAEVGPAGLPIPLYCYGGEPFWGLTIRDAQWADYTWDNQKTHWRIESIGNAMLRPHTWRVIFKGEGRHALIFDEGGACSDSDGDKPLAYGLLLEDGDGFLRGCCDPEP